ncbi:unnamed protein product [Miscanthus lutarioriparius]|uniref:Uncharacterized protein n=1 Tax=Miscanthus lutarioriparius TaxID=422564 RepID=A0A811Q8R0_9POAL|nr:unnamed protein product [Miscanthus lutarioriparius]
MQQVYVPKKVEIPIVPPPRARPQSVITIGSMEAPVTNLDGPIVIEEILDLSKMKLLKMFLELKRRNVSKEIPKAPESAKSTSESAEMTPAVPGASKVSSDDFSTTVAALVGMEVPEVPDEEMVDYEPTPKRVERTPRR